MNLLSTDKTWISLTLYLKILSSVTLDPQINNIVYGNGTMETFCDHFKKILPTLSETKNLEGPVQTIYRPQII